MDIFLQQLINGLVLGSLYALLALGYTMVYGIVNLINFAHGEILMVGALVAWTVATLPGQPDLPLWVGFWAYPLGHWPGWAQLLVGLVLAMLACSVLNFATEKLAYKPLRQAPRLAPLITAMGVSLLLQTLAMMLWKPQPKTFPVLLPDEPYELWGAVIAPAQLLILGLTGLALLVLHLVVHHTRLGCAMRATAENPRAALLMGIRPDAVISATFVLGAVLAALAGVMMAVNYGTVSHTMGFMPGLKAFTAAVLGGIGNLAGAVVGGLALGVIEAMGAGYIGTWTHGVLGSHYQDVFAFLVLVLVLTLRPQGLLGERVADRA